MIYINNNTTHLQLPSRDRTCGWSAGGFVCRLVEMRTSSASKGCSMRKARSTCDRHRQTRGWRRDLPRLVPLNYRNLPLNLAYTLLVSRDHLSCWRCSRHPPMSLAKHPSRRPPPPPKRTRSGPRSPWNSPVLCSTNCN